MLHMYTEIELQEKKLHVIPLNLVAERDPWLLEKQIQKS